MANRRFYKDLTQGEIQYLKTQTYRFGLLGPNYLAERADGSNAFDELPDATRQRTFDILSTPAIRQTVAQFERAIVPPVIDRGTLTESDLAIPAVRNDAYTRGLLGASADGVYLGTLTSAEVRQQIRDADQLLGREEPATVIAGRSESAARTNQQTYVENQEFQKQQSLLNAQDILARRTGDNTLSVLATRTDKSGAVLVTATGKDSLSTYILTADEQRDWNTSNTFSRLKAQEDFNENTYFRSWAKDAGLSDADIESRIANGTLNTPEYRTHLAQFEKLPFATPLADARAAAASTQLATALDADTRSNPTGGGAADKLAGTFDEAAFENLTLEEQQRLKDTAAANPPGVDVATPSANATSGNGLKLSKNPNLDEMGGGQGLTLNNNNNLNDGSSDSGGSGATKQVSEGTQGQSVQAIRNNPLDEYENYTYSLALHVLTKDEYDTLSGNAKRWTPQHTLIAGAGRWQAGTPPAGPNAAFEQGMPNTDGAYLKRRAGWEDNFFFDNLKMTQIQSPSSVGRGTNTVDMEFTIIEPYGLTLLDRMIQTAAELKQDSYMHLCYMLQIDFFDSVKGMLKEHRKYLPITLVGMSVKVSGKGSQYVITAYPFAHKGLMNTVTTTPLEVEVQASSLREFFADDNVKDSDTAGAAAANQLREEEEARRLAEQNRASGVAAFNQTIQTTQGPIQRKVESNSASTPEKKIYQINSYVAMYNGWWKNMKVLNATDPKIDPQNIKVRFADEIIAKEALTGSTVASSGMMARSDARAGSAVVENDNNKPFVFKAGTSVVEVINAAMMSSAFVRDQVLLSNKDDSQSGEKNKTVNWWKILPQVKLNGFDNTLNRWSCSITYFVVPYQLWNTKHPNLPKLSPRRANCVKQYNYLYTGDNRSVLDFQVEFDMLYFTTVAGLTQINIQREERKESGTPGGAQQSNPPIDNNNRGSNSNSTTPVVYNLVPHDASGSTGNQGTKDPIAVALGTIQDSIYSGVNGEMLTVNMKIIGDPTLVKQDDLFVNLGQYYDASRRSASSDGVLLSSSHHANPELNNNSLVTDAGEVLAWVQVLIPTDIDEQTGGLRAGAGAAASNSFTGVYKIMEVRSEFENGKFIQTLSLIRYQEQEADNEYRDRLTQERNRLSSASSDASTSLARNADGTVPEVASADTGAQSSEVRDGNASLIEEVNLANNIAPPVEFGSSIATQINTDGFSESFIERTDLA